MKKQTIIPVKMIVTYIFRNVNTFFDKKSKSDNFFTQKRKYFFKNVLTFSKSGVIIKTRKYRGKTEDCKMNAYNTYGYKENVTAARKRPMPVSLRLLRAIFLTVCERITLRGLRVTAMLVSFFAALGFIGGMECGVISGAVGITFCLLIAAVGLIVDFEE